MKVGRVGRSGMTVMKVGQVGRSARLLVHNNEPVEKVGIELLGQLKIVKFCQF